MSVNFQTLNNKLALHIRPPVWVKVAVNHRIHILGVVSISFVAALLLSSPFFSIFSSSSVMVGAATSVQLVVKATTWSGYFFSSSAWLAIQEKMPLLEVLQLVGYFCRPAEAFQAMRMADWYYFQFDHAQPPKGMEVTRKP